MLWSGSKVKELRRSLGWHEADLSRRLGVKMEAVQAWESGTQEIPDEVCRDLEQIRDQMEMCRQNLSDDPKAEFLMEEESINQVHSQNLIE